MPVSHGIHKSPDIEEPSAEFIEQWKKLMRNSSFGRMFEDISFDTSSFLKEKDDSAECKIEDFKPFLGKDYYGSTQFMS